MNNNHGFIILVLLIIFIALTFPSLVKINLKYKNQTIELLNSKLEPLEERILALENKK